MSNKEYDYYFNGGIDETQAFMDFAKVMDEALRVDPFSETQEISLPEGNIES